VKVLQKLKQTMEGCRDPVRRRCNLDLFKKVVWPAMKKGWAEQCKNSQKQTTVPG
jgi:hypothetical protein